jgi:hypothetical protein
MAQFLDKDGNSLKEDFYVSDSGHTYLVRPNQGGEGFSYTDYREPIVSNQMDEDFARTLIPLKNPGLASIFILSKLKIELKIPSKNLGSLVEYTQAAKAKIVDV